MHHTLTLLPEGTHTGESSAWNIGTIVLPRWRTALRPSYCEVNARTEQGIVFGTTETGILTTLHRLAFNAARVGWKVFFFDAQGSESRAATFFATMQEAGPRPVPIASHGAKSFLEKLCLLDSLLNLPDILLGNPFDQEDAGYVSFSTWSSPKEARHDAQFLLDRLSSYLTSRTENKTPVLLLINHPEHLFDPEQLAPLFARMQAAHGSLFLATSSPEDFGWAADRLMSDASVLLIHRQLSSRPFAPYVAHPWWQRNPLRNTALQRLPDNECFVLGKGQVSHVRIAPVPIDAEAILRASKLLSPKKASLLELCEQALDEQALDEEEVCLHLSLETVGIGMQQRKRVPIIL